MAKPRPLPHDEDLIHRALAGETEAFNTLIERYFGMVFVLAISRVRERETAEDLAQEVFLRSFLHLRDLRQPEHFSAWISRIARNLGTSWAQRRQRSSRLVPMVPLEAVERTAVDAEDKGVREAMEAREKDAALGDALQSLPPGQRDLVLLRYVEDLNQEEIADRLGVSQATVSRQIRRALNQMRGHLEEALRDSAPRFRAPRHATVRAITLITAAGAMSATAKTAITASAQGAGATASATDGGSLVMGISALLQSIPAIFATGGTAMGFGKVAAAVVAVGAVAGGVYVYTNDGRSEEPIPVTTLNAQAITVPNAQVTTALNAQAATASSDLVIPASAAPAVAPVATPPSSNPPPTEWAAWMRQYAQERPGNEGLLALTEVAERFNMNAVLPFREINALIDNGWRLPSADTMTRMLAQRSALESAARAAMVEDIEFPVFDSYRAPVPSFLAFLSIVKLMCADARRLEANGDISSAAQRAIQAARFSEHLIEDNVSLIQNLIGITSLTVSFKTLEVILAHPRLTEETATAIGQELARLDSVRMPLNGLLASQGRTSLSVARHVFNNEIGPGQGQSSSSIRSMMGGDFNTYAAVHERLWADLAANLNRPFWERERMDEAWMQQHSNLPFHVESLPNFDEATTRWEIAWAHCNLCRTMASLRDGVIAGVDWVATDNFDGQPIRVADDRIWSVGPDMQDQQGRVQYGPTNGTFSAGDIVARR